MAKKKPQLAQSEIIEALPLACASEAAAVAFLEEQRWGKDCTNACCPECGSVAVYQMKDKTTGERKRFLWRCRDCSKQYTVRTGTIYAESLIPLHKWCRALWEAASAKNCVSALEMSRRLQVTYKTALFMMHRIRHAMADGPDAPKLEGTIEADETYCGGKPRNKQYGPNRRRGPRSKTDATAKVPVFAVVQRGGEVRACVMPDVNAANVRDVLLSVADTSAKLRTDDSRPYRVVGREFAEHQWVRHSLREYVSRFNPDVHSNTIESFFARVKRGLNGTFHAVSKEHLHRYIDGFAFIYNTREMNDGERTLELIRRAEGKRLMYKEPA